MTTPVKLDALVDLFFTDLSWEQRVRHIAACGYRFIETWNGRDADVLLRMAKAGRACGVELVSIVVNFDGEDEVAPIRAENLDRFLDRADRLADHALAAGCQQGIVTTGRTVTGRSREDQLEALTAALRGAGERVAARGFRLNLEPLNTRVDHPGYFMDSREEGLAVVKAVNLPQVRLLYDLYHMSIMTGHHTAFLEPNIEWIGHFHVAGNPGRHEPFHGEMNTPFVLQRALAAGYAGYFGLEYMPSLPCPDTLVQTRAYLEAVDD